MKLGNLSNIQAYFNNEKYRSLIISIVILLALIGVLLIFTLFAASTLERNTSLINATNKVANNGQAIIKDLFDLQNAQGEDIASPHIKTVLTRLKSNSAENETLLTALKEGKDVTYSSGETVYVPKLPSQFDGEFNKIDQEWQKLAPLVNQYLLNANNLLADSSADLYRASSQAKISTIVMNEEFAKLTSQVYDDAATTATIIRVIQFVGILAILVYFVAFLTVFLRRLQETDAQLEDARQQTTEILNTVTEGLFLIDKDLVLSNEYSRSLETIINKQNLRGKTLLDLLKGSVSEQDLENAKLFIEQLYNPWVVEELIQDLNPLKQVKMNRATADGVESKYLDFNFLRVVSPDTDEISKVFVSVVDITESVRLQENLEKARIQHNRELEMISTILSVNQNHLSSFIKTTEQRIFRMNDVLKSTTTELSLLEKAQQLFRETHSMKGDASALQLHAFVNAAEKQEEQLRKLAKLPHLSGNDFLPFTVSLNELLDLNQFIANLLERLRSVGGHQTSSQSVNRPTQWSNYFNQYAQDIAQRNHKKVQLVCEGFDEFASHAKFDTFKDIAVQLLKNAIVHGIEAPNERLFNGKPEVGQIKLGVQKTASGHIQLAIHDDGQGIDVERICKKAISSGMITAEQASQLSTQEVYALMLKPGFSTVEHSTEDAGQGIGMDIVAQFAQSAQGQLKIESQPKQFTKMLVQFKA